MPLNFCMWVFCRLCIFGGLLLPFFFLEDEVFFFSIVLIVFYFVEGRAKRFFCYFAFTLFLFFCRVFFESWTLFF